MKRRTKRLSVLLCLLLVFSLVLTTVAMAYPTEDPGDKPLTKNGEIVLSGVWNSRDIGTCGYTGEDGFPIVSGMLYRSGNLHDADADEIAGLRVTKIIDLRTKLEAATKKNITVEGVKQVSISPLTFPDPFVLDPDDWYSVLSAIRSGVMETWFTNLYRQYIQDPRAIKATQQFFAEVEENAKKGEPILWHCTAGKDRTGIMCMLLMGALGCDENTIRAEFMNTCAFYLEKARASYDKAYKMTYSKWIASEFYRYETVNEGYFNISWNLIKRYGGMDAYLRNKIGLEDEDFELLRNAYLDGYAAANAA